MVKKTRPTNDENGGPPPGLFDSALANTVRQSAQQIWLAGLGAFSKAQEEGGKVFDTLVKEGTTLQRKTQAVAEGRLGDVASRVSSVAGDVSAKAGQQWDKLEGIFEERTSRALGKLGVPSSKDVQALTERIAALEAQVAKLVKTAAGKTAAKAAAVHASGVPKAAGKRAAARRRHESTGTE